MPTQPIPHVVMLCTGNAARSVMAALMIADRSDAVWVTGAGTHAIEGLPMSQRTRAALAHHGIKDPGHRSHQLTATDVVRADLIVAFERDHVDYVRRIHPEGATKTATIRYLVATLGNGSRPLADRVAALRLDGVEIGDAEAVVDPAGGDEQTFIDCAVEVSELVDHLLDRL